MRRPTTSLTLSSHCPPTAPCTSTRPTASTARHTLTLPYHHAQPRLPVPARAGLAQRATGMGCKAAAGAAADAQAEQLVLVPKRQACGAHPPWGRPVCCCPCGALHSPALMRSCAPVCSRDGVAWRARSVHAADRQRDHAHHHRARPGPALQGPARPPPTPDMRPLWPCPMQLTQLQQQPSLLAHAPALHSPASCRSA